MWRLAWVVAVDGVACDGAAAAGGVLGCGAGVVCAKPAAAGRLIAAAIAVIVAKRFKLIMSLPMLARPMRCKSRDKTTLNENLFHRPTLIPLHLLLLLKKHKDRPSWGQFLYL